MSTDALFAQKLDKAPKWRVVGIYDPVEIQDYAVVLEEETPLQIFRDLADLAAWANSNAPEVFALAGDDVLLRPVGASKPYYLAVENSDTGNYVLFEHRPASYVGWALGIGFVGVAGALLLKTAR